MAKPAARITDTTSCPMHGHGSKAIASGHFEDGSTLSGVFDHNNAVRFLNIPGKIWHKLEFGIQEESAVNSIFDTLFNASLK
ncbi:PAAR domain-containing protein [Pseudomonas granadensis]|uniref:hypothetical protein n=1 Tax=Pseudomonas granadensis TaxID=1421430 RepID=UPI0008795C16|nr:hypothetical protein [Pseudomonas granadensis]SDT31696.1 hypothetical protein SAMN05216579_3242 [Pseudomonas granadensis]